MAETPKELAFFKASWKMLNCQPHFLLPRETPGCEMIVKFVIVIVFLVTSACGD